MLKSGDRQILSALSGWGKTGDLFVQWTTTSGEIDLPPMEGGIGVCTDARGMQGRPGNDNFDESQFLQLDALNSDN